MRFVSLSFISLLTISTPLVLANHGGSHGSGGGGGSGSNSDFSNHWGHVDTTFTIPPEWATTTTPPPGWADPANVPFTACHRWFVDNNSAGCCADPDSSSYGHCHSSSQHNCPGINVKATCNVANNVGDTGMTGSCPWQTPAPPTSVFPLCAPVSAFCSTTSIEKKADHCWGILRCYDTPTPDEDDDPIPCGSAPIFSHKGDFTYSEGSFCFETGNADNTKWCGTGVCKPPNTVNPITQDCCTPGTPGYAECMCPPGDFVNGVCCIVGSPEYATCKGNSGLNGDPQFSGFQGQQFQFHGLADEVFNLISTPKLQVNGHFVYLSSGKCDYNNTMCFQHPGTYVDQLGFLFQERRITLVAGSHQMGMFVHINGEPITHRGRYTFTGKDGAIVSVHIESHDRVTIKTDEFIITAINSDMFFNIETSMLNRHILRLGAPHHTITDSKLCHHENGVDVTKLEKRDYNSTDDHNHGLVEAALQKKYGGAQVPIHGLIGQTWRNAVICGKQWIGVVNDYVASDLFASDYFFNFFTKN